jgi:hypothetical protein
LSDYVEQPHGVLLQSSRTEPPDTFSAPIEHSWDTADLYHQICVRAPYFALRDVAVVGPEEVVARIPVELDPGAEAAPISIAEAGRHLAILGTCAAARIAPDDGQNYYLATGATGRWLHEGALAPDGELLWGRARAASTGRRKVTAQTVLATADGIPLLSMDIDYKVLSAPIFERLFAGARMEMRRRPRTALPAEVPAAALRRNPYRVPLELAATRRRENRLTGTLEVRPEFCSGHFARYPTMPVAVAAGAMTRLAGTLFGQLTGEPGARWLTRTVVLAADGLAHAGQTVTFSAVHESTAGEDHTFRCTAAIGHRRLAELVLTLRRAGEPPVPMP